MADMPLTDFMTCRKRAQPRREAAYAEYSGSDRKVTRYSIRFDTRTSIAKSDTVRAAREARQRITNIPQAISADGAARP